MFSRRWASKTWTLMPQQDLGSCWVIILETTGRLLPCCSSCEKFEELPRWKCKIPSLFFPLLYKMHRFYLCSHFRLTYILSLLFFNSRTVYKFRWFIQCKLAANLTLHHWTDSISVEMWLHTWIPGAAANVDGGSSRVPGVHRRALYVNAPRFARSTLYPLFLFTTV